MADVPVRAFNSRFPLSTTPEETPYRGLEGLWVLDDHTGEERMCKSALGYAKEEVSCKDMPMDDVKPCDCFSDSHIVPTGVKTPHRHLRRRMWKFLAQGGGLRER